MRILGADTEQPLTCSRGVDCVARDLSFRIEKLVLYKNSVSLDSEIRVSRNASGGMISPQKSEQVVPLFRPQTPNENATGPSHFGTGAKRSSLSQ